MNGWLGSIVGCLHSMLLWRHGAGERSLKLSRLGVEQLNLNCFLLKSQTAQMGLEIALAVTGVALAGPGILILFRDFGTSIVSRVDTVKNAPKLVRDLRKVGRVVCESRLQANLEITEHAFALDELRDSLRADLVRGLEQMRHELLRIDSLLGKLVDSNSKVNRLKLAMPPLWTWSSDAKRIIRDFDKARTNFEITINLVERSHRAAIVALQPLPSEKYKPRLKPDGSAYTVIEENSHIWAGGAEIRDKAGNPNATQVIIEYAKEFPKELIPRIASHLVKTQNQTGLLKCLGYHGAKIRILFSNHRKALETP